MVELGYIGTVKSVSKKTKSMVVDGGPLKRYDISQVERYAYKYPPRTKVSYSVNGPYITWIGAATPERIRIANELKARFARQKAKKKLKVR